MRIKAIWELVDRHNNIHEKSNINKPSLIYAIKLYLTNESIEGNCAKQVLAEEFSVPPEVPEEFQRIQLKVI